MKLAYGDNFDKIHAVFAEQAQGIAEELADATIDADKPQAETQVQTYVNNLEYKYSEDNGQNATQATGAAHD